MAAASSITRRGFAHGLAAGPLAPIAGQASTCFADPLGRARHHYREFAAAMATLSQGAEGWYVTSAGGATGFQMHGYVRRLVPLLGGGASERQDEVVVLRER